MTECPKCKKTENIHSDELHTQWIHMCYNCGQQWWTDKPRESWIPQNEDSPQQKKYNIWFQKYLAEKRMKEANGENK